MNLQQAIEHWIKEYNIVTRPKGQFDSATGDCYVWGFDTLRRKVYLISGGDNMVWVKIRKDGYEEEVLSNGVKIINEE